jgi:hypothetical protein
MSAAAVIVACGTTTVVDGNGSTGGASTTAGSGTVGSGFGGGPDQGGGTPGGTPSGTSLGALSPSCVEVCDLLVAECGASATCSEGCTLRDGSCAGQHEAMAACFLNELAIAGVFAVSCAADFAASASETAAFVDCRGAAYAPPSCDQLSPDQCTCSASDGSHVVEASCEDFTNSHWSCACSVDGQAVGGCIQDLDTAPDPVCNPAGNCCSALALMAFPP